MSELDTICAVSTPAGNGGIGIIRMSGKDAVRIASSLFRPKKAGDLHAATSHTLHYGHVVDPGSGEIVDEALLSVMRSPATYTREDVVEINCHGGMVPLWRTMTLLIASGARQAEPGEFTKRAFLNGRIDLAQVEAVMDVIRSKTELSHRAANELLLGGLSREVSGLRDKLIGIIAGVEAGVDFPEEDIETPSGRPLASEMSDVIKGIDDLLSGYIYGRVLREGFATAIAGRPNVGKSSLLNALIHENRAIVTEIPGTTRDTLEEYLNMSGMPLKIVDTAGIRHSVDRVEQEGVRRSLTAIASADIVLAVLDGSEAMTREDQRVLDEAGTKPVIAVINKSDLPRRLKNPAWPAVQVEVSCKTGAGLDDLRSALLRLMREGAVPPKEHAWAVNLRQKTALEQAKASLEKALGSVQVDLSPEFIAIDLRDALDSMGLVIGATYTDDILERIFTDFCIGK